MAKYIDKLNSTLETKGTKKEWLADALGFLRYVDFWKKMRDDSFTQEEKDKILILLGDDSPAKKKIIRDAARKRELVKKKRKLETEIKAM